jgi:hypothetical protein
MSEKTKTQSQPKAKSSPVWLVCLSSDKGFRRGVTIRRAANIAAKLIETGIARKATKDDLAIAGIDPTEKQE